MMAKNVLCLLAGLSLAVLVTACGGGSGSDANIFNVAPVARDQSLMTDQDTAVSGMLIATDANGDSLTFSIVTPPALGKVTLDDPVSGAFTYTPDPGVTGTDQFRFQASDGDLASNTATVTVAIADTRVTFSSFVRKAYAKNANAEPDPVNGIVFLFDVNEDPTAFDDLIATGDGHED